MFDIPLRPLKDRIISPLLAILPKWLSPNTLTALAFLSGLSCCLLAARHPSSSWTLAFWILNRLLDCLDGAVARQRGQASELGGFLDLLGDFIIYSLLPISIACGQESSQSPQQTVAVWRTVAVLEGVIHINNFVLFYVAAVAAKLGTGRAKEELTSVSMKPALVEGFEAGMLFTGMLVWPKWLDWWCWGMSGAVAVGTGQRVGGLVRVLRGVKVNGD